MTKQILSTAFLIMTLQAATLGSALALGYPPAEEVQNNFQVCTATVPGWTANWGVYNVGSDIYTAAKACNKAGATPNCYAKPMGCKISGHNAVAGFYCACR